MVNNNQNQNYYQTSNLRRKRQPHILTKVVDPNGDKSLLWNSLFGSMCVLEVFDVAICIITLNRQILFKVFIFNIITVITVFIFLLIPAIWAIVGVTQRRLDYNVRKYTFRRRLRQGKEKISKFSHSATEDTIRGTTGILHYDRETGLSDYQLNEAPSWVMTKHPYTGNRGFDLICIPRLVDEDEVITANLHAAEKSLPPGTLKKTILVTGQSFSYLMDDVKEQLQEKNLSTVRYKALISVWDKYKDRASTNEPLFLIHIGLPFHFSKEDSLKEMNAIRNGYEKSLNQKGFDTILIKNPEDWSMILTGMLTGKMFFRGDIVEN